eukprot:3555259-Rhodomonas_salina.2
MASCCRRVWSCTKPVPPNGQRAQRLQSSLPRSTPSLLLKTEKLRKPSSAKRRNATSSSQNRTFFPADASDTSDTSENSHMCLLRRIRSIGAGNMTRKRQDLCIR